MAKEVVEKKEEIVENKEEVVETENKEETTNKEEIVENKEETTDKKEEIIEDVTKPEKKDAKKVMTKALDIIAQSRGFKGIKEAEAYVESEGFGKLHVLDQDEFKNWLKEIKK